MTHRFRRTATRLALLAYLVVGMAGAGNVVLCIEENRVAFEVAKCGPGEPVQDECPAPCVDVPLVTATSRAPMIVIEKDPPVGLPPVLASFPSLIMPISATRTLRGAVDPSATRTSPLLISLRTVVLLI